MRKIIILIVIGVLISNTKAHEQEIKEGAILWRSEPLGENLEASSTVETNGDGG